MDVVYVFGSGSNWDDRELMYSLCSVQKFLRGVGKVFIVGAQPRHSSLPINAKFIPFPDKYGAARQQNVRAKLIHAIHQQEISEEFLFMNDDFFLRAPVDIYDVPFYRQGTLPQHIEWRADRGGAYLESLRNTDRVLRNRNMPRVDFEVHVPIRFAKDTLLDVLDDSVFDWSSQAGLCFRSLYGNWLGEKGEPTGDVKLDAPLDRAEIDRRIAGNPLPFFSIGPAACTPTMENVLRDLFVDSPVAA